jgi:hypothetical protein
MKYNLKEFMLFCIMDASLMAVLFAVSRAEDAQKECQELKWHISRMETRIDYLSNVTILLGDSIREEE